MIQYKNIFVVIQIVVAWWGYNSAPKMKSILVHLKKW